MEKTCYIYKNLEEYYFIQRILIKNGYKHSHHLSKINIDGILDHREFDNVFNSSIITSSIINKNFTLYYNESYIVKDHTNKIYVKNMLRQEKLNKLYQQ